MLLLRAVRGDSSTRPPLPARPRGRTCDSGLSLCCTKQTIVTGSSIRFPTTRGALPSFECRIITGNTANTLWRRLSRRHNNLATSAAVFPPKIWRAEMGSALRKGGGAARRVVRILDIAGTTWSQKILLLDFDQVGLQLGTAHRSQPYL